MKAPGFEVAILLVSWNGRQHLEACLDHLQRQIDPGCPWQIWVWDNGSKDGTQAWLRRDYPAVNLVASTHNLGFAEAVNRLVQKIAAQVLILLNNDTAPREDWLAQMVHAFRQAPGDVAAIGGMALDWQGKCIDFIGGAMTFDGHAFQKMSGKPISAGVTPAPGTPLLFANGANMLIRRSAFCAVGGFDKEFFAYYEDVDLGWRLWAQGYRIHFEPRAIVHHRSCGTSDRLGLFNRGLLFERNAFLNAYKNFDDSYWQALMPAILLTFMHRTQSLLEKKNPGGATLGENPFKIPEKARKGMRRNFKNRFGQFLRESQWPGAGTARQIWASVAGRMPFFFADVHVNDLWTIAQFRAMHSIFDLLDLYATRRKQVLGLRKRSDREIFGQFPLQILATYPGDDDFFKSSGFQSLLPDLATYRLEFDP